MGVGGVEVVRGVHTGLADGVRRVRMYGSGATPLACAHTHMPLHDCMHAAPDCDQHAASLEDLGGWRWNERRSRRTAWMS